jgi:SAM-dependent methyltransferase
MKSVGDELFIDWYARLERRHLSELSFTEVRRAVQALSVRYVDRRRKPSDSGALGSAGKRAAFALYYGPLHFLTVRGVVENLNAGKPPPSRIIDLGCGSGAAAAAWAFGCSTEPRLLGIDRNRWAVDEARWNWNELGLAGQVRRGELVRFPEPRPREALLAAYAVNELDDDDRRALLHRLLGLAGRVPILIVEPIARRVSPWWVEWATAIEPLGGRADEWRFEARLPERLRLLDRAAGLDHRELTARSLFVAGSLS